MGQAAPHVAHRGLAHVDQTVGNGTLVHQVGRQDKQRHGQQGEAVQPVEHFCKYDTVGDDRKGRDSRKGHEAEGIGNGHADHDKQYKKYDQ